MTARAGSQFRSAVRVRGTGVARLGALLLAGIVRMGGALAAGGMPGMGNLVHDPVAYVQHVRNVQSALVAEAQRARQLQQQWASLLLQDREHAASLRQLARLPADDLQSTQSLTAERLRSVTDYLVRLDRLDGSLDALRTEAVVVRQAHALSRLTWPEYVEREHALARHRIDRHQQAFVDARRTMARVEADFAQVRTLQGRIAGTEGSHQSLQMLNQQMSLLLAQNAAAQASLAEAEARRAHDAARDESIAARVRRLQELDREAADRRAEQARTVGARSRAEARAAIEARRLSP
jgi:hypothetical protein